MHVLQFSVRVLDDYAAQMQKYMPEIKEVDLSKVVLAPMPGMLKSVDVQVGDQVSTLWAAVRAESIWTPNTWYAEVC